MTIALIALAILLGIVALIGSLLWWTVRTPPTYPPNRRTIYGNSGLSSHILSTDRKLRRAVKRSQNQPKR